VWQCYKNNVFGTVGYSLLGATALIIIVIFFVIIIDKYWMCQVIVRGLLAPLPLSKPVNKGMKLRPPCLQPIQYTDSSRNNLATR
jgi:hypothetical protein